MTEYNVNLNENDLLEVLTNSAKFTQLVEAVLNQVLDAQMTEHLGAEYYERNVNRAGHRNGIRIRKIATRVGNLTLRVPQTRDGSFSTTIFNRYQRKEQAFILGLMEMYIQGTSTRKVTKITEELCGVEFSKSTVSKLTTELDTKVTAFRNRRLDDKSFPFIIVDALQVDAHVDDIVRSVGILGAYGVNETGRREVLGVWEADSESEASWEMVFKDLKARGLKGVDLVVSDNHTGLVNAIKKHFQGAAWQRCQVHFMRNILGLTVKQHKRELAELLKAIFHAPDKQVANILAQQLIDKYEKKAPTAVACFERGLESTLTVLAFPSHYRQKLRTTNLAERTNEEIRRRERVIRIFPNKQSALRLIGAVLSDTHNKWYEENKYFDMNDYLEWKKENISANQIIDINSS